jgi:acylphosphatase
MPSQDIQQGQEEVRVHLKISGRVTAVGFRFFVVEKAQSLGLFGWVANSNQAFWSSSGEVEVVAEGPKEDIGKLIEFCRIGPPLAKVNKIEEEWGKATGEFSSFEVKM